MDEKIVIAQLKQGSEQAFGLLYDCYWHSVSHFASLYLKRADEIEDTVHEVFIRLWEARLTLREDSDLNSFLFVMTRNLIFTQKRKSFNHSFYSLTVINALADNYADTGCQAEINDLAERLDKLVAEMPAARRQVFEMSRRRYMSYREISAELGITEKTVERHINEALKYLKAHLATVLGAIAFFLSFFFKSFWG